MSYTFAQHGARCRQAAEHGVVLRQYVQIQSSKITACGYITDCWTHPTGVDLLRVQLLSPFRGLTYQPFNRVRPCSGIDGRCSCAGETRPDTCQTQAKRGGQEAGMGLEGVTC